MRTLLFTFLIKVKNIRDTFQGNPGAWLIPMDMAQLEKFNGTGPTRMPEITIVTNNGNDPKKVTFGGNGDGNAIPATGGTNATLPIAPRNGEILQDGTAKDIAACQTLFVNAKAAIIRDRFHDITYACPDPKRPKSCKEHVDYAVRLGGFNLFGYIISMKYQLDPDGITISH